MIVALVCAFATLVAAFAPQARLNSIGRQRDQHHSLQTAFEPLGRFHSPPQLNIFDGVKKAVDNVKGIVDGVKDTYEDGEYCPDGFVRASHILFLDADGNAVEKAKALKARIESGEFSFGDAALEFSSCPTRDLGGKLGVFQSLSKLTEGTLRTDSMPYDGKDTSNFDAILFSEALGVVHQVQSQWGAHLVLIEERGGGAPPTDLLANSFERPRGTKKAAVPGNSPTSGFGGGSSKRGKGKTKRRKK